MKQPILTRIAIVIQALLMTMILVGVGIFTLATIIHTQHVLTFPYPLDYGEGPLLIQGNLLQQGTPIWHLYSDPAAYPYVIVNYPPLYPLLTAALSLLTGEVLLAGRLLSLLATLGTIAAIPMLATPRESPRKQWIIMLVLAFLLFSIPIVREWAVLLRVDMLGVCLGIWGLVALHRGKPALAGVLLLLSLYTKPSLLAAPAAATVWVLIQAWRIARTSPQPAWRTALRPAITLLLVLGLGGGGLFALLYWASDGWFIQHVVAANANRWDGTLAKQFWLEQFQLRAPLILAAVLVLLLRKNVPQNPPNHTLGVSQSPGNPHPPSPSPIEGRRATREPLQATSLQRLDYNPTMLLASLYTLASLASVMAVGKVGAYTNYFLEWYVGLVWIVIAGMSRWFAVPSVPSVVQFVGRVVVLLLLLVSFVPYTLFWSPTKLHRAGILEPNPPRLAYAMWHDIQREPQVLAALTRAQDAIQPIIANTDSTYGILTDRPGIVATAGRLSRLQAFEHRQLYDQGLWDQRQLLKQLANGDIGLVVVEYLGNWLTPEIIAMVTQRYAHNGSLGIFDRYRPVAMGNTVALTPTIPFANSGLALSGYAVRSTAAADAPQAAPGDTLIVTLHWQAGKSSPLGNQDPLVVVLSLTDGQGGQAISKHPLFYAILSPNDLRPGEVVQHMQTIQLPPELPPRSYQLTVALATGEGETEALASSPYTLMPITIAPDGGHAFEQTGYYVPAPFLQAWQAMGDLGRVGLPLTPAVPFAGGRFQCFEYTCLEEHEGQIVQRNLGEQLYFAETQRSTRCMEGGETWQLEGATTPCPGFLPLWQQYGAETLGMPISGEIERNGFIVQWTTYARLERAFDGSYQGLGRLGDDVLRLPPGVGYRWKSR